MLAILSAMLSGIEIGMFLGPLWRRFVSRGDKRDILLYGQKQPTSIPFLDSQIQKHTGELDWLQKKSHAKLVQYTRSIVNTKAFELVTAKVIKDKWILNKDLDIEFKVI